MANNYSNGKRQQHKPLDLGNCSAELLYRKYSGQIGDHNSPQENSNHLPISGVSTIRPQHRTIRSSQVNEENNGMAGVGPFYSIGTRHQGRMVCHQHKSYMAMMYSLLITVLLPHSSQEAQQQAEVVLKASQRYYNTGAQALPEGMNVAVQDHRTRPWDTYGVVAAIGPQQQYHIKTQRRSVLIRNRRFIRRRVPESVPYLQYDRQGTKDHEAMEQNTSLEPRRSSRERKSTYEDPNWN